MKLSAPEIQRLDAAAARDERHDDQQRHTGELAQGAAKAQGIGVARVRFQHQQVEAGPARLTARLAGLRNRPDGRGAAIPRSICPRRSLSRAADYQDIRRRKGDVTDVQ